MRANRLLMAQEYHIALLKALRRGITVTRYTLDPNRNEDGETIDFEIRVTRIGKLKLPRVTKGYPE